MGTIAALTQSVGGEPTPIAKEIDRFVKVPYSMSTSCTISFIQISAIIALFVGIVFAVLAAVHGSTWIKVFTTILIH